MDCTEREPLLLLNPPGQRKMLRTQYGGKENKK